MNQNLEGTPHLKEDEVSAYIDGRLDAESTSKVEDHLADCNECREELKEVGGVLNRSRRRRRLWTWSPVGLAAAAAVSLLLFSSVPSEPAGPILRDAPGGGIQVFEAVSPVPGDLLDAANVEFIWRTYPDAATYRINVTTLAGETVFSRTLVDTAITLPGDIQLNASTAYLWFVDGILETGETITTEVNRFQLNP